MYFVGGFISFLPGFYLLPYNLPGTNNAHEMCKKIDVKQNLILILKEPGLRKTLNSY